MPAAPLAAVYATRKGARAAVVIVSRKVPEFPVAGDGGFTPVTVELPFAHAKSITLYRMTGDPKSNNLAADNVKIQKVDIPAARVNATLVLSAATGADERGLAPASTYVYVFDGVDQPGGGRPAATQ